MEVKLIGRKESTETTAVEIFCELNGLTCAFTEADTDIVIAEIGDVCVQEAIAILKFLVVKI